MSNSPITFLSSGNLLLKDCDAADGFRPASVDGGVVLSAKKKAAGITYQVTATEATVKNARALSGAWVSMSKPMGECGVWGMGRFLAEVFFAPMERRNEEKLPRMLLVLVESTAAPMLGDAAQSCILHVCVRYGLKPAPGCAAGSKEGGGGGVGVAKKCDSAATTAALFRARDRAHALSLSHHPPPPRNKTKNTHTHTHPHTGDYTTGTVTYDLAGKTAAAAILNSIKLAGGKALDVGARWAEKGNAFSLEVGGKPHPAHRFFTSINPATRAVLGSWTADIAGLTLQAARNFAKGSDQLSVGRTLPNGVKAVCSYAPQDAVASATFGKGPLRGGVRAKRLPTGGFGKPSISLGVDRDFQVESVPVPFLKRSPSAAAAPPPPPPEPAFSFSRVADSARSLLAGLTEGGNAGPRYVRGIKVETYSVA
jgi:hypothetical protein